MKVRFKEGRFICSELDTGATSDTRKYLFRSANVWWKCVQYCLSLGVLKYVAG